MQINIENHDYAECIDRASLIDMIDQLSGFAQSCCPQKKPWQELTVHILGDHTIAPVHIAVNGCPGSTDVITQRYESFPGEEQGLIGEIFVNFECACRQGFKRLVTEGWSVDKELMLYIAHGCDHLNDAEDLTEEGYLEMRQRELGWIGQLRLTPLIIKPIM